ncbi:MAG: hypothetical protein WC657_05850 [Candidatus Paceibacterota bacterium]|jgi:hypothetical protein
MTALELIRERIEAPLALADRAYAGQADPADPWTRVGRHMYELDEPLAWKAEPGHGGAEGYNRIITSFDPDAPIQERSRDLSADVDQYTVLRRAIDAARQLKLGQAWTGIPSKLAAKAIARDCRDSAERLEEVAREAWCAIDEIGAIALDAEQAAQLMRDVSVDVDATSVARRQFGKVSRRGK